MSEKTILVWFRNDLRIHDNEILSEAVRKADKVLPVYCFDPFYFKNNASGNPKTGNLRARFLLESVADLRKNLQSIGGDLVVRFGDPAEMLPQLAGQYQVNEVYHHREVAYEETDISARVEAALWKIRLNLKHFIGHTLYHKEDLPFPIKDIPDSFAVFKKKIERDSSVRHVTGAPARIVLPAAVDTGEIPTLAQLGLAEPVDDIRATERFTGGENAASARLQKIFSTDGVSGERNGKNGNSAGENLARLSPWIAFGCISLRQVYWAVAGRSQSAGTFNAALLLNLLWRDYFRFMFKKHGQKFIVPKDHSAGTALATANGDQLFESWKNGETGIPLIDAVMHELNATGYTNNYCRQLVAGFLVNDLKLDWKKGAAYFEEKLIDYSPASNWGNWAFIAGINDAHESRYQIAAKTAASLEIRSDFIDTWMPLPRLAAYQG